jgi:DNA-binding transcriptional LysR family regulator
MGMTCYKMILMPEPLETAELLAFAKTAESKSLSRAAAELGVPRATISRRLARLEARLGARLLRRTTRSLALTDAGDALYRHARIVLDAVSHAEQSVRRSDDVLRGDLRVSVPPLTRPSFLAMLCDFAARYPQIRVQVHFSTALVDLRRDGYDVALRATHTLEPGLIARTVARVCALAVASPAYIERHGSPRSVRDLRKHRCLMGFARGELPATHWPAGRGRLHVEGAFFSNEVVLLHEAALRGLGIALLPRLIIEPHLATGELVPVLPGVVEQESHIAVVYAEREFVPPQMRAFVDALVAWAEHEFKDLGGLPTPRSPRAQRGARRAPKPSRPG